MGLRKGKGRGDPPYRWLSLGAAVLLAAAAGAVALAATLSQTAAGSPIYYVSTANGDADIWSVVPGGKPVRMAFNSRGADDIDPAVTPDGRWLAFSSKRTGDFEIWAVDLQAGSKATPVQVTRSTSADTRPAWSPDAKQIAYVTDQYLIPEIMTAPASGCGRLVKGCPVRVTSNNFVDTDPSWSPDGRLIAFASRQSKDPAMQIYTMTPAGGSLKRLTSDSGPSVEPSWSPDGKSITFISNRAADKSPAVYVMASDGSGQKRISGGTTDESRPTWSPDGKEIAYRANIKLNQDIYRISASGGAASRVTTSGSADYAPAWGKPATGPSPTPTPTRTPTPVPPTATPTTAPTPSPTPTAAAASTGGGSQPGSLPAITSVYPEDLDSPLTALFGGTIETTDAIFLGEITTAALSLDSVCSDTGAYGSIFSQTSIRNPDSPYGAMFGTLSAFDPAASDPPHIYVDGVEAGRLTTSIAFDDAVDPAELLSYLGCYTGF
jgi:dipeptidyl aminopeptidase/acylaminoacyl peptidase